MTDLRKAAEMALDALHNIDQSNNYDAIEALRQALAQPEQEPETVMAKYEFQTYAAYKIDGEMKIGVVPEPTAWVTAGKHTVPLEVAPVDAVNMSQALAQPEQERVNEITRQFVGVNEDGSERWVETEYRIVIRSEWVGLTEDETDGLIHSATYMDETDMWHLVSLVEERLKEKNNG